MAMNYNRKRPFTGGRKQLGSEDWPWLDEASEGSNDSIIDSLIEPGNNTPSPESNTSPIVLPPEATPIDPFAAPSKPKSSVYEPIGQERLNSPNQNSPKDIFLSAAQNYDYNKIGDVLTDIQAGKFGDAGKNYYTGWTAKGDKLMPPEMAQRLASQGWGNEWGEAVYADPIDVIAGYDEGTGNAQGWNWGVQGRSSRNPTVDRPTTSGFPIAGGYSGLLNEFMGLSPMQENLQDYNLPYQIPYDLSSLEDDSPLLQEMLNKVWRTE